MLAPFEQDNIADYFPVHSYSWAVGQHCTSNFLAQCWHTQIKTTLHRLFSVKTCLRALGQHCTSNFQTYLDHIDQKIFLCNVVPAWSIQHCIGYFPQKSCLFAMGQHCTVDFLVQRWPRKIRTLLQIILLCKIVPGLCSDRWVK